MDQAIKLEGFLISFEKTEHTRLLKKLAAWGYEPNSDGLKLLLLDMLDEENSPERRIGQAIGDFVSKNPTIVTNGLAIAQAVAGRFVGRIKRKGGT